MSRMIVIVGCVAGGATAATRLRRLSEQDRIIIFERGPHLSFSNCSLPYYLSGAVAKIESLVQGSPESFASRYNIDARVQHEVLSIDRQRRQVEVRNRVDGTTFQQPYDALILSPGAAPVVPPIPGIDQANVFTVRNVVDIGRLAEFVQAHHPARVTVVGGGFIGIECAENLALAGHRVTVVEALPQILSQLDADMAPILHKLLLDRGIELHLSDKVTRFTQREVILESGTAIETDAVVLAIGVRPETELAKGAGLTIGQTGAIAVDANYRTSDPRIYAIGDAIELHSALLHEPCRLALAGPAHKQARAVADHIHGRPTRRRGVIGSSVVQVFDYTAASTGLAERLLIDHSIPYEVAEVIPKDRVGLMPGAEDLHFKLLFEVPTGRILGAQAVGRGEVAKRIDVVATVIKLGGTVDDLRELELCYAPPYGTAKDVVNIAGLVAGNLLEQAYRQVRKTQVRELVEQGAFILDVRERHEFERGHITTATNIPLSQLRGRIDEVPKDRSVYVHCRTGQRSYNAVRILQNHGHANIFNIAGGFLGICLFEYFTDQVQGRKPIVTAYNFS